MTDVSKMVAQYRLENNIPASMTDAEVAQKMLAERNNKQIQMVSEQLTALIIVGFVIVFISILISELKIDPVKLIFNKRSGNFNTNSQIKQENIDQKKEGDV